MFYSNFANKKMSVKIIFLIYINLTKFKKIYINTFLYCTVNDGQDSDKSFITENEHVCVVCATYDGYNQ